MSSTIREALESDARAIAALTGQLGYPASPSEIEGRLDWIKRDGHVFVAEIGGAVIGWVHIHEAHFLESPAHAEIGGLVVEENHRGSGVGTELMAAAERWAVAMGYTTVRVRSNVIREAAHRFYKRSGYSETKRQAVFVKDVGPPQRR